MKTLFFLCLLIAAQCSQAQLSQDLFHLRELSKRSPLKALRLAQHLQNRYPQEEALALWLQDLAKEIKHLPQQYLQLPSPGLSSMAFHSPSQLLYTLSADGYLRAWNLSSKQAQYQSPALFEASDPQATWSSMPRSKICLQGQFLALFTQDSTQIWSLDLQTHYSLPLVPAHYEKLEEEPSAHAYNLYPDPQEMDRIWLVFADSTRAWSLSKRRWIASQALLFPKTELLSSWEILGKNLGFATVSQGFISEDKSRKILWQSPIGKQEFAYQGKAWGGFANDQNLYVFDLDSASNHTLIRHFRYGQALFKTHELRAYDYEKTRNIYACASDPKQNNWAVLYDQQKVYWNLDDSTQILLQQEAPIVSLMLSPLGDSLWVADEEGMILLWCKADVKPQSWDAALYQAQITANERYLLATSERKDSLYWLGLAPQQLLHRLALPQGYTLKEFALLEEDLQVLVLAENYINNEYVFFRFEADRLLWKQSFAFNRDFPYILWGHSPASQTLIFTQDSLLRVIDLKTGKIQRIVEQPGLRFFSGREEAKIVWDAQGQRFALPVQRLSFDQNGELEDYGSGVEVWRLSDLKPLFQPNPLEMMEAYPLYLYDTALLVIETSPVSYGAVLYNLQGQRLIEWPHGQSYQLSQDGRRLLCTDMEGSAYYYEVLSQTLLWKRDNYEPPYTMPKNYYIMSPWVRILDPSGLYTDVAGEHGHTLWDAQAKPILSLDRKDTEWTQLSANRLYGYALARNKGASQVFQLPFGEGYWARLPQWHLPSFHRVGARIPAEEWRAAWRVNPQRKRLDLQYLRAKNQYLLANALEELAPIGQLVQPVYAPPLSAIKITDRYLVSIQSPSLASLPFYPPMAQGDTPAKAHALSFWDYRQQRLRTLGNFKEPIQEVELSPQGDYALLNLGQEHLLFAVQPDTMRYLYQFVVENFFAAEPKFSPSGRFLAYKHQDSLRIVRLSDFKAQTLAIPRLDEDEVPSRICYAWDAERVAFFYARSQQIIVKESQTGKTLATLPAASPDGLSFNPKGQLWYAEKQNTLALWGNTSKIKIPFQQVHILSDKLLVQTCLGEQCTFRYYDAQTGALIRSLNLPQQVYLFSEDGRYLVGTDARVWSWESEQAKGSLPLDQGVKYEIYQFGGKDMLLLCYFSGGKIQFFRLP